MADHSSKKVVKTSNKLEYATIQCALIVVCAQTPDLTFDSLCYSTCATTQSNPPDSLPVVSSIRPQPDNSIPLHPFPNLFEEILGLVLPRREELVLNNLNPEGTFDGR